MNPLLETPLLLGAVLGLATFFYVLSNLIVLGPMRLTLDHFPIEQMSLNSINNDLLTGYPGPDWCAIGLFCASVHTNHGWHGRNLYWCPRFSSGYQALAARRAQLLALS